MTARMSTAQWTAIACSVEVVTTSEATRHGFHLPAADVSGWLCTFSLRAVTSVILQIFYIMSCWFFFRPLLWVGIWSEFLVILGGRDTD